MPHQNISVSFSIPKEQHLLDVIKDAPSPNVKMCIEFWLKYSHLLPELDNTSDLLTVVAQMATKQAELIAVIERLSERINGLQTTTVSQVEISNDENSYNTMMDFE